MWVTEEGGESSGPAFRMREDDVRFVAADGRGYEICCGEDGGWRVAVPEFVERWWKQLADSCCKPSVEALPKGVVGKSDQMLLPGNGGDSIQPCR